MKTFQLLFFDLRLQLTTCTMVKSYKNYKIFFGDKYMNEVELGGGVILIDQYIDAHVDSK